MPAPPLRLAICRRCRWPSRRAAGADDDATLLEHAKQGVVARGTIAHCRVSQCLNCCDAGHTVRVELDGDEVALVGIRTCAELDRVLNDLEAIGQRDVPATLTNRVYQVWRDGTLVWHRNLKSDDTPLDDVLHAESDR
jgi:hypothetical protein